MCLVMMSAVKNYFKQEFSFNALALEHPKPSDFYISVWQKTRSPVPLLIWRVLLFFSSVGIVISSTTIYVFNGLYSFWFIYLTHWGLSVMVFATAAAVLVSARCYLYGPISAEFSLPWYVKTYWVLQNVAVPLAFLITVFYWTILYQAGVDEELNHGLDIAVHGLNTLVMFLLVVSSGHPSRPLHVYQPFAFALCYLAFGLIYYYADGVDTKGNRWVYSVVNWAQPGTTAVVCIVTGLLLCLMHFIAVGIALVRDRVALIINSTTTIKETVPLRPTNV